MGTVRTKWYVWIVSTGFPDGYMVFWNGRMSWCQQSEFVSWRDVRRAIERRLAIAGLKLCELLAVPSKLFYGLVDVRALVQRSCSKELKVEG